tara:strand:+ start:64 stop:666 length:603 start_codon:yes stop_codon:yes gene_type:complete
MLANYVIEQNCLSPEECLLIKKYCVKELTVAQIAHPTKKGEIKEGVRKAKACFIFRDKGVYVQNEELKLAIDKVIWMVCSIADEMFRCPLNHVEPIQFGQYKEGNFYDWHMDAGPEVCRDISASVFLDDPENYEGGDFQFFTNSLKKPDQTQGSLIVFPSLMTHSVAPITKGARHSLVVWGSRNKPVFNQNIELAEQENA